MKNKVKKRIIYIVVAALWAMALYRTWENWQIEEEIDDSEVYVSKEFTPTLFNKDTFDLELPDHDPFLSGLSYTKPIQHETNNSNNTTKNNNKKKQDPKPVKKIQWPKIEYLGFVRNRNEEDPLCLVKIDGRNFHLAKGVQEKGLFISSVFRDSIHIVFEEEERTFLK